MSREADEIERRVGASVLQTLGLVGADLAGEAARDAPIEEGTLRGSAYHRIEITASGAQVVVGFATPYAAVQHERTDFEHPRGGKAHYLSDPLKAKAPTYVGQLAGAVRRGLRGGGL